MHDDVGADPTMSEDVASDGFQSPLTPAPPHAKNWHLLTTHETADTWPALDPWLNWLRPIAGRPSSAMLRLWHRSLELLREPNGLHLHWLTIHIPESIGTASLGRQYEFADAHQRLDTTVTRPDLDSVQFVLDDVAFYRHAENDFCAGQDLTNGVVA